VPRRKNSNRRHLFLQHFSQIADIAFDETGVAKIKDLMPGIYFTQLTTKTATIVKKWI